MKTKYYLILLLLIIMAAGARTMFEIAYQGLAFEHDNMSQKVGFLIGITVWFVLMMIADVWIVMHPKLSKSIPVIALLSVGILAPVVYMLLFSH